jgi:hypothetical protein
VQSTQSIDRTEVAPERLRLAWINRRALPWTLVVLALTAAGVFYLWQSAAGSDTQTSELRVNCSRSAIESNE